MTVTKSGLNTVFKRKEKTMMVSLHDSVTYSHGQIQFIASLKGEFYHLLRVLSVQKVTHWKKKKF